jgi:galactokinase
VSEIAARLREAGMSDVEALAKSRLHARCLDFLGGGSPPSRHMGFFVPGRIEILGKHTDYAGGRSLLCAVQRGFVVVVAPRQDGAVKVTDVGRGETRELAIAPDIEIPRADWSAYVAASLRRLARNFPDRRRGAEIAFASDLPAASGMSSSSALSTGIFFAMNAVNDFASDPRYRAVIASREDLAGYLGTIENGQSFGPLIGDLGVGTFGGSEDHTAILCCKSGIVSRYSFSPVRAEGEIPLPPAYTFVVAYSGVPAEKGGAAQSSYNELSLAAQRIILTWNTVTDRSDTSIAAMVESEPEAARRIREVLRTTPESDFPAARLVERFDQFVMESCDTIPHAAAALARSDVLAFGAWVERSQLGAEVMLRNQIPETIALVQLARRAGAHAASAFGGGFGGSVWALVDAAGADAFAERWREMYARDFPGPAAQAEFIVTRPGPGAMRVESVAG